MCGEVIARGNSSLKKRVLQQQSARQVLVGGSVLFTADISRGGMNESPDLVTLLIF